MTGRARAQGGLSYIAVLLLVAIMGVWLAATANVWHLRQQRDREQELLFIGHQFRSAIEHYAAASAGGARRLPLRLEDLLLDERTLERRRHLRRIYVDPMTGDSAWGLVRQGDGQIIGVHSLSTVGPLKTAGFDAKDSGFSDKASYADWVFMATLATAAPASQPKAPAPRNSPDGGLK